MRLSKNFRLHDLISEIILIVVVLIGQRVLAQDAPKGLKAVKFVVAERIVLKDSSGKDLVLKPGLLSLQPAGDSERTGGDGEPPRGAVHVVFHNENGGQGRGILEINFGGVRRALFWLDQPVVTDAKTGEPLAPTMVRSAPRTSGQGLGLRWSVNPDPHEKNPTALLVLENDQRAIADVELLRGGDHGDPR